MHQARILLAHTRSILAHKHEREKLRGERFNIFSILGMESAENETHSAFLSELLNPAGSHLKGDVFLRLFLDTIGAPDFDLAGARIAVEQHLGTRDDVAGTGGRADIFIRNASGRSITIENKIYAGDQTAQILRYCNYNAAHNRVYYLTLRGEEPSEASRGKMQSGTDFFLLSYQHDIINWLRGCLRESVDQPILRETIRQYIILLQKLTGTLDTADSRELDDLLFEHFEEADAIAKNFDSAKNRLTEAIRQELIRALTERLSAAYVVAAGNDSSKQYSQIWLWFRSNPVASLHYGVESFSGRGGFDGLFIGIINRSGKRSEFDKLRGSQTQNAWWANVHKMPPFEGYDAHMGNAETLRKLYQDTAFRARFIEHLASEAVAYLSRQGETMEQYLEVAAQQLPELS